MLLGKVAAPSAACCRFWPPLYEKALNNSLTLFYTQPGYFWSDSLMALLNDRDRAVCWLRLEPEDQDPAETLLSLIAAARRIEPDIGTPTLAAMRASPGPAAGWEPLYAQLGQEFVDLLPGNCVLVLEHVHHLAQSMPAASLLLGTFLPWVARRFPCLLTSEKPIPLPGLPGTVMVHHIDDLLLDSRSALDIFKQASCQLAEDCIQAALQTNDGRAVALAGLCSAGDVLDPHEVENAILKTGDPEQLFTQIAQSILRLAQPDAHQALAVANQLAYSHPDLISASLGVEVPLTGPWLQPLSDGWVRVYPIWDAPLKSILQAQMELQQAALLRAADFLFSQGAVEWSIRLYFECSAMGSAARAIAGIVDNYLDLGLWHTLHGWLKRLPPEILEEWPRLVYVQGEIYAMNGEPAKARVAFISASQSFANHQDMDGFCQSKLAVSALAVQLDDPDQAWSSALAASSLAARSGLVRQSDWANWQLGRLAAAADRLDDALAFFTQVSQDNHDPLFEQLFGQVAIFAQELQEARRQRELHRQAYLELHQSEMDTARQLTRLLSVPLPREKGMPTVPSWSQIHPVLKFPSLASGNAKRKIEQPGLWQRFFQALDLNHPFRTARKKKSRPAAPEVQPVLPLFQSVLFLPQAAQEHLIENHPQEMEKLPADEHQRADDHQEERMPPANLAEAAPTLAQEEQIPTPAARGGVPDLAVHCLGPFQVFQNDQLVDNWSSRKALAIFKYLLVHRGKFVSKDVLMEVFWPEADPEAARRNLHQAIYTLRQTLHSSSSDFQYIVFVNDRYRLNPDLEIWSDDEDFERHYEAGNQLEKSHQVDQAVFEYEIAANLYRGDFMAEDLYEDWPTSRRQYLWQTYLTMVYHLAEFYYSQKEYSIAAGYCQRIIYMDDCQEEAHQNLMKCYLAQGRRYQAVHQYHLCRQALKTKMNLPPSPEMQELYRQVLKK